MREDLAIVAEAKSELDLLINDANVLAAARAVLAASERFIDVVTGPTPPKGSLVEKAIDEVGGARDEFTEAASRFLDRQRRTWFGRFIRVRV